MKNYNKYINSNYFSNSNKLNLSNDELLALWSFDSHVERLIKFAKPFYKDTFIIHAIPSKRQKEKNKNIPTELRLSAAINELRPFMLNNDSINFCKIRNIVSKQPVDDIEFRNCMKQYKKIWSGYDINKKNNDKSVKMSAAYSIDNITISTYAKLLGVFIYGKYIHNGDNPENTAIVSRIENSFYYSDIKVELGIGVTNICDILSKFNKDFIKPILNIHKGTIKQLNWQSINKKTS